MTEPTHHPTTEEGLAIIRTNTYWAAGVGIIPIPIIDFVGITIVNIKMLRELAAHYDVPFNEHLGKSILSGLFSGALGPGLAYGSVGSVLRAIPGIGQLFHTVAGPIMAGAVTYAVGKVFLVHFGTGGNLFNFDPEVFKDYFKQQLSEGVAVSEKAAAPA
jgi:uncharacterized protein (DUF697 family)